MNTAAGVPSSRALVSSSRVTFLTAPSAWSTSTRISAMTATRPFLDELLRGEEVGELDPAAAFIGHDDALGARRRDGRVEHLRPGAGRADLGRLDRDRGGVQALHRLLLGGHDPLEGGVARLVDLLDHR